VRKSRQHIYFLAAAVALITVLAYLSCLKNGFVNWDDTQYILDNSHIRSFDAALFKWAFFDFYAANWHPLTWISHAADYALWGLNPLGHHLTNIILHAMNTFLVVLLAVRLLDTYGKRRAGSGQPSFLDDRTALIAAGVTGLLFGLHPVHVESVAWVAERKDLLCGLFFLLSVLAYIRHAAGSAAGTDNRAGLPHRFTKHYLAALGFFILALLSKPMAVSLPVVLLILDWYPLRRIRSLGTFLNVFVEKLPFIAFSLASSVVTIMAQRAGGAMTLNEVVPLPTRVLVAAKALVVYLREMMWPADLVPFYPYPRTASPASFEYLFPLLLIAGITAACIALSGKRKVWLSTWAFYTATLVPVLGIVQVGGQAMADRYTYLPSLGPFLIMGVAAAWGSAKIFPFQERIFSGVLIIVLLSIPLSYLTVKQIGVWENGFVLWSYVIQKEPAEPLAYKYRGAYFQRKGQFDKALEDYGKAMALDPSDSQIYLNRGTVFCGVGMYKRAVAEFDKAIDLNPSYYKAYNNRAFAYGELGEIARAIADLNKAIALDASSLEAYVNLGVLYGKAGLFDKAIEYFDKSLSINRNSAEAYANRGVTYSMLGRRGDALEDFNKAIQLKQDYAAAYYQRGSLYQRTGEAELALKDFRRACDEGYADACKEFSR
jgi:tetratricopeptide (TPR) repeat protein